MSVTFSDTLTINELKKTSIIPELSVCVHKIYKYRPDLWGNRNTLKTEIKTPEGGRKH